ncbi:SRPBCC family protein [Gordonia sp. NPDC003424]
MPRTYQLDPVTDVSFFDDAPITYRIDVQLPVTPARAWSEFTRQNTLDWCRAIKSIEFTSPAPYGVNTSRQASLGVAKVSEHFFVWDEDASTGNYRNAFYAESITVPGVKKFGELTEIQPAEVGCRLIWLFALELATSAKAVSVFSGTTAAPVFKTVETDTLRHFANLTPQS